jgi:hypothetical protein
MSKQLTSAELTAIAALLTMTANEYGSHGCNDYDLPNTEANKTMLIEMVRSCYDVEEQDEAVGRLIMNEHKELPTYDWLLMEYLAKRCKEAAK